jgi:diguanylate cyclase (GGDEF)-like protein
MRRRSLTATFALVSVLAIAGLGITLVATIAAILRQQAVDSSVTTAEAYVRASIIGHVHDDAFGSVGRLQPVEEAALTEFVRANSLGARSDGSDGGLIAVRLWNNVSQLVYDSRDASRAGFPDGDQLDQALTARRADAAVKSEIGSGSPSTDVQVLDVYVPVLSSDGTTVIGAAEVLLDYGPTSRTVSKALRTLSLIILAGLVMLWLLLFRTVGRASRRLRQSATENARLALLDPLTGLPNRRLLSERLERAADETRENGSHLALLLLDIDRFKEINDTLGHDRGDQLLVQVAGRLTGMLREGDTVARLGGDEFAVLLRGVASVDEAQTVAARVLRAFENPYQLDELVLHVESSAGIALMPDHATDEISLLRRADVAMYVSKANHRGLATYTSDGDDNSTARLVLLGDLRVAIDADDQLEMHYQPKIDLSTGEVNGLEALVRWRHPHRGLVSPAEFIPLAETTGLMHALTARVLQLVCRQIRDWSQVGWELPVAVNLSALNLAEPELVRNIRAVLAAHDVPARLLEFEITESAIVADPVRAANVLRELTALGATVALDDFGIGNTSISQLRDLPVQTLKIDQSFVSDLEQGSDVLVKVMTDLGHEFGLVVVAEGVEDEDTVARLRLLGCDVAQGFFYARPVAADQLLELLQRLAPAAAPASR